MKTNPTSQHFVTEPTLKTRYHTVQSSGSECGLCSPTALFTTCHWPATWGTLPPRQLLFRKGGFAPASPCCEDKASPCMEKCSEQSLAYSEHRLKFFFLLYHYEEGTESRRWFLSRGQNRLSQRSVGLKTCQSPARPLWDVSADARRTEKLRSAGNVIGSWWNTSWFRSF